MKRVYGIYGTHKEKQSVHYWHASGRRERERDRKILKEIMAENFAKLGRDLDIQVHEAHKFKPKMISSKKHYNKTV